MPKKITAKKNQVIQEDPSVEEIENGFMLEIEKEIKDTCEQKKKQDIQFINKMVQKREKLFEKETEKNKRHFQKIIEEKQYQIDDLNCENQWYSQKLEAVKKEHSENIKIFRNRNTHLEDQLRIMDRLEQCNICRENYDQNEHRATVFDCRHMYCWSCFQKDKEKCYICKKNIFEPRVIIFNYRYGLH